MLNSFQAEQVSFVQVLDKIVIAALAVLWFVIPSDGIALVTQWFFNKVVHVSTLQKDKCLFCFLPF